MATEVLEQASGRQHLTRRAAPVEEFWALPESMLPTEYVNGEIITAPTPTSLHQRVVGSVFFKLTRFVSETDAGEVFLSPLDVVLPSGDVVQPDVFFLTGEQVERGVENRVKVAPALAVEILSPSSVKHDTLTKRDLYERNRVREYWVVDPRARTIDQLVLRKKHYALTQHLEDDTIKSAALAGFEMRVGELLGLGRGASE